jgi:cytochrome c peroxidase
MKHLMSIALSGLLSTGCVTLDSRSAESSEPGDAVSLDDVVARHADDRLRLPNHVPVPDATGAFTTVSTFGFIDLGNEFFQDLGSNGRRCVSCHLPTAGWSVTPGQLRAVFEATRGGVVDDGLGLGAVFRTNDGSNSPLADVSTLAKRRAAYSMLLTRGLIRIGLPIPAGAEFELVAVDDPYRFASAAELSLFRRPLPTANLKFDSTVMWDGRETVPDAPIIDDLLTQASNATTSHAQGNPLSQAQRQSLVDFQLSLASAQVFDTRARGLHDRGARGGADEIHRQEFYIGINDNFGDSRTGAPFTPIVFTIYSAWTHATGPFADARRAVARGQAVFNTKPIAIAGVSGINDEAIFGNPAVVVGTCTTCHDTPNAGNHSVVAPLDIGLSDASRRTPDMPLYTLRNKATGELRQVTDPGRALISGKWKHIGRFKGPMLRNLASRAPYFHNGFAADLAAAVEFYEDRFQIGFTPQERSDLIAFLRTL